MEVSMNIGIDLGGTNTAAALVDESGTIIKRAVIPTNLKGGPDAVIDGLMNVCANLLSENGETPDSIGIGVPGTVNAETGEVIFTANLPLVNVNITDRLKEKYACPVCLGNDANCAALGEVVAGGAKDAKNVVFITLGTGVGGGIVIDGYLHTGLTGAAGEIGHMVTSRGGRTCGCGRRGCWETYASATGLIRTSKEFMDRCKESILWKLCEGDQELVNGRMVFEAFRAGDHTAGRIVRRYIAHLATGIVNLINILEPELICIGGGIANEWDSFGVPLQVTVNKEKYTRYSVDLPQTRIVKAELGNDAGLIGAAALTSISNV